MGERGVDAFSDSSKAAARMSVWLANARDLAAIARLFVEAFVAHPVAALPASLQRKFIAAHLAESATLVAYDHTAGRIVGFAIGGEQKDLDRARRRFIRRNALSLAFRALSPRDAALRVGRSTARADVSSSLVKCELRYLAVDSRERGRGIGSALLRALEEMILGDEPYYVWVMAARTAAMRFYVQHGFRVEREIDGHVRMIKSRERAM